MFFYFATTAQHGPLVSGRCLPRMSPNKASTGTGGGDTIPSSVDYGSKVLCHRIAVRLHRDAAITPPTRIVAGLRRQNLHVSQKDKSRAHR